MQNGDNVVLDLPFKGTRDYLHSTDIFPALDELARAKFGSDTLLETLILRKPIRHAILVSFTPQLSFSGSFRARHSSGFAVGWLGETKTPLLRRNPLDILALTETAEVDVGYARLEKRVPGCAILDQVVSLIKLVVAQTAEGRWWLSQIHFERHFTEISPIETRIRRNFNNRFLSFDILEAGDVIGFARVIHQNPEISVERCE